MKPFLAFFEKFKYLTTATLTPKRNTVCGESRYVHVDKKFKKGTEESWQMTMKILISSIFVQLLLEDAIHKRWLKNKACVFMC